MLHNINDKQVQRINSKCSMPLTWLLLHTLAIPLNPVHICIVEILGRDSAARMATGRSGDLIPVVARLSAQVHTGYGAHPASNKNRASFSATRRNIVTWICLFARRYVGGACRAAMLWFASPLPWLRVTSYLTWRHFRPRYGTRNPAVPIA